jgi:predicted dehydrogenase
MKKKITKNTQERQMTRRQLVGSALAAAGVITGAPTFLRALNLHNKLNIAMIACGGRGLANMNGDGGSRRRASDAPSGPPTGIPAENITVLCDVNQHAVEAAAQRFPKAKKYHDFRRVFDHPNDFDAVMVSTPEHTHTLATYLALTHGKHVYCEKPLTHDVWEARLIRQTAAKYPKLATQTGNQGHASPVRRQIKELLLAGAIGPVREVHVWAGRAWGLQSAASAVKYDKPHGFYHGMPRTCPDRAGTGGGTSATAR